MNVPVAILTALLTVLGGFCIGWRARGRWDRTPLARDDAFARQNRVGGR